MDGEKVVGEVHNFTRWWMVAWALCFAVQLAQCGRARRASWKREATLHLARCLAPTLSPKWHC